MSGCSTSFNFSQILVHFSLEIGAVSAESPPSRARTDISSRSERNLLLYGLGKIV